MPKNFYLLLLAFAIYIISRFNIPTNQITSPTQAEEQTNKSSYSVIKIVDGDTIDVQINEKIQRIRLIGIDAPESTDLRAPVHCFGNESKQYLTQLLQNQAVTLESDASQSDQDQYQRLLRYVYLNEENVNLHLIKQGYAYEYTYDIPYQFQQDFIDAQVFAKETQTGLWHPNTCNGERLTGVIVAPTQTPPDPSCLIKGNLSADGRKIYHLPECRDYSKVSISLSKGEAWFCNESQAQMSGWEKAKNC